MLSCHHGEQGLTRVAVGDAEAKQLYEIFDDAAGEKRALNRRDFQKALGALEVQKSFPV